MKLVLVASGYGIIPMNKMEPGQFAWYAQENTIVFATWRAAESDHTEANFVALNHEGSIWGKGKTDPVLLLPSGTLVRLEE